MHELGTYLAKRGHQVTVIACKPGPSETTIRNGYVERSYRRLWSPWLGRAGITEAHAFYPVALDALLRGRYDVVQSCGSVDALAAQTAGCVTGTPHVFFVNGLPPRVRYYRTLTFGGAAFRRAVRGATEVIAISEYVQRSLNERFQRPGRRIPVPVDTRRFALCSKPRTGPPLILCTAALDDRRKGGRVLMRAFNIVKQHHADARLQIACALDNATRHELLGLVDAPWQEDIEWLGEGRAEDLPQLYGAATVSVLPSLWEAFGLVVIESLACGTPVVGTRDGALPELLNDARVGRLFDPGSALTAEPSNAAGLARALVEGVGLGRDSDTAPICRAHVERFGWQHIGPELESLYLELCAGSKQCKGGKRWASEE